VLATVFLAALSFLEFVNEAAGAGDILGDSRLLSLNAEARDALAFR
jgi:hypothetical protein